MARLPNVLKEMRRSFDLAYANVFVVYPDHQISIRVRFGVDVQDEATVTQRVMQVFQGVDDALNRNSSQRPCEHRHIKRSRR